VVIPKELCSISSELVVQLELLDIVHHMMTRNSLLALFALNKQFSDDENVIVFITVNKYSKQLVSKKFIFKTA